MLHPITISIAILMIACLCFSIYMNRKIKLAKTKIDLDHERTKYELYKQELLAQDFSKLSQWMDGKAIDAFTSASVPQSTGSKVKEMVTDGVKYIAFSAVGIKRQRIETASYLVLSGNDLHYLDTDIDGDLDEHLIFDNFRIEKAKLEFTGVLKETIGLYSKSSEKDLPKVHCITFMIDDKPLSLNMHDRLNYEPDTSHYFNLKKQVTTRAKYQVVGERFVQILQDKFPNLTIS